MTRKPRLDGRGYGDECEPLPPNSDESGYQQKSAFVRLQHGRQFLSELSSSTWMVWRLRNSATMMARPTATSAAATVRMKKTKTLPSIVPLKREKATSARVEATSMSSRHM